MISHVGSKYSSTIQANDVSPGDCHALYSKLQAGTDHQAMDLVVNTLTSFSSAGLSVPKYVVDITLSVEHLTSITPAGMTIRQFVDILYVQSLLKGLPDAINSFKTTIRLMRSLQIMSDLEL